MKSQIVTFLINCPDNKGLVAKITNFFYNEGFNILSCQQYVNAIEQTYFMRIRLNAEGTKISKEKLEANFMTLAEPLNFNWSVHYGDKKAKVAIMVSHVTHCLYDLLEKQREGVLDCEVDMIISNHDKLRPIAEMFAIPYFHLPVTKETKRATAHYATVDLDEGPIIEQDVERVTHDSTPKTLKQIGADIERRVLAKAVKSHLQHQIIVANNRAVVFPESKNVSLSLFSSHKSVTIL